MREYLKSVIPWVTSPALVMLLWLLLGAWVKPLVIWKLPAWCGVIVAAFLGAFIASFVPPKNARTWVRIWAVVGASVLFFTLLFSYDRLASESPYAEWETLWDWACYIVYMGTFAALGYVFSYIVSRFIEKGWVVSSTKDVGPGPADGPPVAGQ
jgi:hypothetical protein